MTGVVDERYREMVPRFPFWEKTKDLVEQLLDVMLNYRQNGHPGGSRSKLRALIVTLLGGVMSGDIRHPEMRFADRFVLGAGHTVPMIYATLERLYTFPSRRGADRSAWKIRPAGYADTDLIPQQWNETLRVIATIKLKEVTASDLIRA